MELSAASVWEWTKLFVRDPRTGAQLVKAANLPLQVSMLMIVLAGVVSTAASGLHHLAIGAPSFEVPMADGQVMEFTRSGPFQQGIYAVITGLGLAYAIYQVGRRMGGRGSLADIMAVTAMLQLVVTVIVIAQTVVGLAFPLVGLGLMLLGAYVFFRGLGHAVDVGHSYSSLGKSAWVTILSFLLLAVVIFTVSIVLGISPQGAVQGA